MQRTPLVENGVIRSYLLNLQTAAQLKMAPTAMAAAKAAIPHSRNDNLTAPAGQTSIDNMIKGSRRAFWLIS